MKRIYEQILLEHVNEHRQMLFLAGPRQVGKTTTAKIVAGSFARTLYLNWDVVEHRRIILAGEHRVAIECEFDTLSGGVEVIIFDEIHKYTKWKLFLKGFFDLFADKCRIIVTGSGHLNIFKSGGDSLMGRYFLYRMHPLSVAELLNQTLLEGELRPPQKIADSDFEDLLRFGGFPEPLLAANKRFYNRWRRLRTDQLLREDLRDLSRIQDISRVEILAENLVHQAGSLVNYSKLANSINVSVDTIRRWILSLESLYFSFSIRPWSVNIPKSLRKQPKVYLWDWSLIPDKGNRNENFIASHLLKAAQWWTDVGLGEYELYFIRDKQQREVDFLLTRNKQPWLLIEVKSSENAALSPHLGRFQKATGATHALQVVIDQSYIDGDCFSLCRPTIVPARTFLSQLV